MLKIKDINKYFKTKHCKHNNIIRKTDNISKYTSREIQKCLDCKAKREILYSDDICECGYWKVGE